MMRIWGGMLISILCSAVAWQDEVHRLDNLQMSIWLLTPLFFLLGVMEGLGIEGLEHFTRDDDHLPKSVKQYLFAINTFVVIGIGNALNILCVYSNTVIFLDTLDDSCFDLYYKYLTIYVTLLNCVYLMMVSIVIYGGIDATQVNEASIVIYRGSDPARLNQESASETTVLDTT
ncbi:hypothetical protein EZV62_025191 [Acer yangbiense]|uniref:Uncharacterized protein n=1 Tax=Acer yangbiense TaxID=1000413 RepID=A0A5C7GZ70_9ROSI|nr:hypothetical protein EZV62_025191 [Acer yangbiense]